MLWQASPCDGRRDGNAPDAWTGHGLAAKVTVLNQDRAEAPAFRTFGTPVVARGSCDIGRSAPPLTHS
jgi:hypothetical protein